jgi:hypothetical protein
VIVLPVLLRVEIMAKICGSIGGVMTKIVWGFIVMAAALLSGVQAAAQGDLQQKLAAPSRRLPRTRRRCELTRGSRRRSSASRAR